MLEVQMSLALPLPPAASLADVKAWAIAHFERTGERPRLRVSVSGGRTSAFMAKLISDSLSAYFEIIYTFANTSREHPDTLRFVSDVSKHFGLKIIMLEGLVHYNERKASTFTVIEDPSGLRRDGELFEAYVRKYGLPNQTFKNCTRELKTNPMEAYTETVMGWASGTYLTALGIRADERRRVKDKAMAQSIVYPLAHWWPTDKQDVLTFWEDYEWDLKIPEHWGNCVDCHKKSDRKLAMLAREDASIFEFPIRLDRLYSNVGPNTVPGPRKRYRGYMSTLEKLSTFEGVDLRALRDDGGGDGCTESCEIYETEPQP